MRWHILDWTNKSMRKIAAGISIFLISITLCSCDVSILPGFLPRVKGNIKEDNLKLGIYHLKKGNIDKAIRKFTMSTNAYPDYAPGYFYLAVAYSKKGKPVNEQIKYYEKAIELEPNMTEAYNNLGKIFLELKDYEKAERQFTKILAIDKKDIFAYLNLGTTYLEWNKYNNAEEILKQAMEIDSANPYGLYLLGLTYEKMNRSDDAILYLQKALEISRDPELIKNATSIIENLKKKS